MATLDRLTAPNNHFPDSSPDLLSSFILLGLSCTELASPGSDPWNNSRILVTAREVDIFVSDYFFNAQSGTELATAVTPTGF